MSIKYILAAMEAKVGNPARKLVLIKLADNANDDGFCYPSYQNIADHCELGKRSVIDHIKKLQDDGFLTKTARKTQLGNTSNGYQLIKKDGDNSTAPSANIAPPPSANFAPPSANSAPPPSANFAPRTCHSFEPVKEPKETSHVFPPAVIRVVNHLASKIRSRNRGAKLKPESWSKDIDRAIRIDGRNETELIAVIDWIYTAAGSFWVPNILSGKKLREKFDQLSMSMTRGGNDGTNSKFGKRRTRREHSELIGDALDQATRRAFGGSVGGGDIH